MIGSESIRIKRRVSYILLWDTYLNSNRSNSLLFIPNFPLLVGLDLDGIVPL
jgi:hypothetical protein